jgi:hypothetical protein
MSLVIEEILMEIGKSLGTNCTTTLEIRFKEFYNEVIGRQKHETEITLKIYIYAFFYRYARYGMPKRRFHVGFSAKVLDNAVREIIKWEKKSRNEARGRSDYKENEKPVCNLYSMKKEGGSI